VTSTQRTRSRATRSAFGLFGSLYRLSLGSEAGFPASLGFRRYSRPASRSGRTKHLRRDTALFPDIKSTSADSLFLAEGRDRLPKRGGMLVAGRRQSGLDFFFLRWRFLRRRMYSMMSDRASSSSGSCFSSLTSSFISVRPSLAGFGAIRSELSGITCFNAPFGWSRGTDGDGQLAPSTSRLVTGL